MAGGPKLLLYDLEVSPALGWFYPPTYQTNIMKIEQYQILISFSYDWFDEGRVKPKCVKLDDFAARFKADRFDDTDVVKALHRVMLEADHTIAYNGDRFDIKMANTFFLKHGLDPLPENRTIDPLKTARQKLRLASNRLDEVSKELGSEGKTDITVGSLWYPYLMGTEKEAKKAGKLLKAYNNQDIIELRHHYMKFRPLMKNHPNLSVRGNVEACPKCQSTNRQYRGYTYTNSTVYRRLQCQDCKGWYRERAQDKDIQNRPDYVN